MTRHNFLTTGHCNLLIIPLEYLLFLIGQGSTLLDDFPLHLKLIGATDGAVWQQNNLSVLLC